MNQEQEPYQPQAESKAPDSVRIAEPVVATSEVFQEPRQLTDDMIEGVSSRSVAISARSEGEDMTTRAISSPENRVIPYNTVITDISARITRTNLSHDSVDSGDSRELIGQRRIRGRCGIPYRRHLRPAYVGTVRITLFIHEQCVVRRRRRERIPKNPSAGSNHSGETLGGRRTDTTGSRQWETLHGNVCGRGKG